MFKFVLTGFLLVQVLSNSPLCRGWEQCGGDGECDRRLNNFHVNKRTWQTLHADDVGEHQSVTEAPHLSLEVFIQLDPIHVSSNKRFLRSMAVQGISPVIFGPGRWLSSKAMEDAMRSRREQQEAVIMFISNVNDALLLAETNEIVAKVNALGSVVFAARNTCQVACDKEWPSLETGPYHLDPNTFIGRASQIGRLLDVIREQESQSNSDEDTLAAMYLSDHQQQLDMYLDVANEMFQSFDGQYGPKQTLTVHMKYRSQEDPRLFNFQSNTYPVLVRGNGNNFDLNRLGDYMPLGWTAAEGCIMCQEARLSESQVLQLPLVMGLVVDASAPFVKSVAEGLVRQLVPSNTRWVVSIANSNHSDIYQRHIEDVFQQHQIPVTIVVKANALEARRYLIDEAAKLEDHYLLLTSNGMRYTNPNAVFTLLAENRDIIGPAARKEDLLFSTFWPDSINDYDTHCVDLDDSCGYHADNGECTDSVTKYWMSENCAKTCGSCSSNGDEFTVDFKSTDDFSSLAKEEKHGVWTVPILMNSLLMKPEAIQVLSGVGLKPTSDMFDDVHWQMSELLIAQTLRRNHFLLHVSTGHHMGQLIDVEYYNPFSLNPDLLAAHNNIKLWSDHYLHENYSNYKTASFLHGRCWDIYQTPLFNERFCSDLIAEAEHHGDWSAGDRYDTRMETGYEPVPTRDIHFTQFGFQKAWTTILLTLVAPIQKQLWPFYNTQAEHTLDFIVKYEDRGQNALEPHDDASTYTFNVALNRAGVDFIGGGTRFHNQNCTIQDNPVGYALFHPGRLTHTHEGLPIVSGLRYILVSFVDQPLE